MGLNRQKCLVFCFLVISSQCVCVTLYVQNPGWRMPSHLSLSSSFFRSFMSRWTTFKTCSASSSVRPDRSSLRPISSVLATMSFCCWSMRGGGEALALLLWGQRLGQPCRKKEEKHIKMWEKNGSKFEKSAFVTCEQSLRCLFLARAAENWKKVRSAKMHFDNLIYNFIWTCETCEPVEL